jgi:hypothetical protein
MNPFLKMVRLVGLEPTTGKTPVDFKPTAYANFATAAPATRHPENITRGNHPHNLSPHSNAPTMLRTTSNSSQLFKNVHASLPFLL